MKINKFKKDGKVAVLYSPVYGAGWSTWNTDYREWMIFDKGLVELALNGASEEAVEDYVKSVHGDEYICLIGWDDIMVHWMDKGEQFTISEYDGAESIDTIDDLTITA